MGKKDWEKLAESDDFSSAVGASQNQGRGWKVFSGLLVVATAAFVAAYYVPLYRAHDKLREEYRVATSQASTFRQQLSDAVGTLNQATEERDKLRSEVRQQSKQTDDLEQRAERIERNLQPALRKFSGKGKLSIERDKEKLRVALWAPGFTNATSADLSDFGKKALCAVGTALKTSSAHVKVLGLGIESTKADSPWQLAASRAGTAAQHLGKSCGLSSTEIEAAVRVDTSAPAGAVLAMEIAAMK
jgi:chemotaxis protein MotB